MSESTATAATTPSVSMASKDTRRDLSLYRYISAAIILSSTLIYTYYYSQNNKHNKSLKKPALPTSPSPSSSSPVYINHLSTYLTSHQPLHKAYYIMRHGLSEANELRLISSNPSTATSQHGLTDEGKQQVTRSVNQFYKSHLLPTGIHTIHIYTSDYLRAVETANILYNTLKNKENINPHLHTVRELRERWFGDYDNTSDENYANVWKYDSEDEYHVNMNVECLMSVIDRTTRLVSQLESKHENCTIILVAHGDVLQILQTAFTGISPRVHRTLPHLAQAEIRRISLRDKQSERVV